MDVKSITSALRSIINEMQGMDAGHLVKSKRESLETSNLDKALDKAQLDDNSSDFDEDDKGLSLKSGAREGISDVVEGKKTLKQKLGM